MLASVRDRAEMALALAGEADIIDLKEPRAGALGAASDDVIRDVVRAVAGRVPVSAVTGDLPMAPDTVMAAVARVAAAGADVVKIGFFPGGEPAGCARAVASVARRVRLVAVLFADRAPDLGLLPLLRDAGFTGAMLDTADKSAGRLLDAMDIAALGRFVAACRAAGLEAGLAGGLELPDVPRLLLLGPDVLGFRGALCGLEGRGGAIDAEAVRRVRGLIPRASPEARGADHHILAARHYVPDTALADRVFVRDLVLPVSIGAYAHERAAPQRVRFNVDVWLAPQRTPARDMRDVFSYDIVTDGIRLLVDEGHVDLVETLAERVAALVLAHPRVDRAAVRLEKLDVGQGKVGVEIVRRRRA